MIWNIKIIKELKVSKDLKFCVKYISTCCSLLFLQKTFIWEVSTKITASNFFYVNDFVEKHLQTKQETLRIA